MQNACKLPYLPIGAFLKVSGGLLGLLHRRLPLLPPHKVRGRSLSDQPPGAPLCELRVMNVPRGQAIDVARRGRSECGRGLHSQLQGVPE